MPEVREVSQYRGSEGAVVPGVSGDTGLVVLGSVWKFYFQTINNEGHRMECVVIPVSLHYFCEKEFVAQ